MPDLQKDTISVFLGSFGTPDEAFGARSLLLWVFHEFRRGLKSQPHIGGGHKSLRVNASMCPGGGHRRRKKDRTTIPHA